MRSASKAWWAPARRGMSVTSARVPDRDPTSAGLDNLMLIGNIDTIKLIQKRFIKKKVICRATPAQLHGPRSRCR